YLDRGSVAEARHAIPGKTSVHDAPVLEFDRLEQRPSKTHHVRTFDLIAEFVRIDDGATVKGRHHARHSHLARRAIDQHFRAGRNVAALLEASCNAEALPRL